MRGVPGSRVPGSWSHFYTMPIQKWKIPHTVLESWTLCFSSYKNCELKVKLWWVGARKKKKSMHFYNVCFTWRKFSQYISEGNTSKYSVLNKLSEYIYFYISKSISSYIFLLLVFKIVENFERILKNDFDDFSKLFILNSVKSISGNNISIKDTTHFIQIKMTKVELFTKSVT